MAVFAHPQADTPPPAPHRALEINLAELRCTQAFALAFGQRQFGAAQILAARLQMQSILAWLQTQFHRPARRLVEFGDQPATGVADIDPAVQVFDQRQARYVAAHVGHHHVAGTAHLYIVARMLGAARGASGPRQGLGKGELIGLVERHPAIAGDIRRAAQARNEIVGKERGANRVGFLRCLIGRT